VKMKVQGKCDTCGRKFLLSQIGPQSDAPGRCPFCGARFARHYNSVLIDAVSEVEIQTPRFINVLAKLQAMETGFDIDMPGLLASLEQEVLRNEKASA
jgi:DNA-directed RNA polymerase subunit RPC12/RpoP